MSTRTPDDATTPPPDKVIKDSQRKVLPASSTETVWRGLEDQGPPDADEDGSPEAL